MNDFNAILGKVKNWANAAGKKAEEVAETSKLKMQILSVNGEISKAYEALGKLVYEAAKNNDSVGEEMEAAMKGMLDPEYEEKIIGNVEIRRLFKFSKVGNIAGSYVTDGIINSRTNSHMELIAQGISNIILGFFGCIPTTGGVARGVQSAQNGARTPIAAIVHSVSLFVFLIVLMPFIKLVPLPVLAAILMVVSYNMLNVNVLIGYLKHPKSDLAVLICSCVLTFAFDLVFAIEVGLIMAAFLFMKRMSDATEVQGWRYINDENDPDSLTLRKVPAHTLVYEVSGPMFFAVSDKILKITGEADTKCIIIRMRSVNSIDATAMNSLDQLFEKCKKKGITLILSHVNVQPRKLMDNVGFIRKIGKTNMCDNIDKALSRAKVIVAE